SLRAIDNVALPAMLAGAPFADAYARAGTLLGQVGLDDRLEAYPGELSGGEQRRAALARALVNDPPLLLAAEPTSDLDEESAGETLLLPLDLHRARGTPLLVVTHNPDIARRADRILHLRGGRAEGIADCGLRIADCSEGRADGGLGTSANASSGVLSR